MTTANEIAQKLGLVRDETYPRPGPDYTLVHIAASALRAAGVLGDVKKVRVEILRSDLVKTTMQVDDFTPEQTVMISDVLQRMGRNPRARNPLLRKLGDQE